MTSGANSYSLAGNNFSWFPNVIGNPRLGNRSQNQWFNEAAFAAPTAGTFGNEGRNQLTGPALTTTNLSLSKTFAIWEQVKMQVRGEKFSESAEAEGTEEKSREPGQDTDQQVFGH